MERDTRAWLVRIVDRSAAAGGMAGETIALLGARWLQPLLCRHSTSDRAVFAAVPVVLMLVAALASLLSALRATPADPNRTLRTA